MLLIFALEITGTLVGTGFLFSIVKALCVGTYEEFITRGYLLRTLADSLSLPVAVTLSSLVFALLHLTNDNASLLSTLGLFINALYFASAAILTRRLSAAIGAHIGWNLFEGTILGFPVSGDLEPASVLAIRQLGHPVFTGWGFMPEAGLVGILASLGGIGVVAVVRHSLSWCGLAGALRRR